MSEKILIVDDEQEIADLVALYLRSENYEVRKIYSAARAWGFPSRGKSSHCTAGRLRRTVRRN